VSAKQTGWCYDYCRDFLKLNPKMYHLTDINDILSPYDSHPHLGAGQLNFNRIFDMIPDNSIVTFETNNMIVTQLVEVTDQESDNKYVI